MSIHTVEIRAFAGPATVELAGVGVPEIVEVRQGPQGEAGEDGAAATITVGTTTTGNAGTNASVTNSGTSSAAVFNFTIPRGDTGAAGPNSVTSATTTNFTSGEVLFANSGVVGSVSRSGIDTRTTFPNDDVTAATHLATRGTLVRRNATNGRIAVERFEVTTDYDPITIIGNATTLRAEFNINTGAILFGGSCELTGGAGKFAFPNGDPLVSYRLRCAPIVCSGPASSAVSGQDHIVVASHIFSDPTPSEGMWFRVIARNGTATVGGTAYSTSGTIIERSYHSGAWANRVYNETPVLGTNVSTALSTAVGSAGAFVVNGGALGTPSSGTLTSCTGLPISTGVSGLGTGVATFLATPSSANLRSAVTDETGSGGNLMFSDGPTFTGAFQFSSAAVAKTSRENLGLQTLVLASDLSATTTAFVNSSESVSLAAGTYRVTLTMYATTDSTTGGLQARLLSSTTTNSLTQYRTITWDQNSFNTSPLTSATSSYTRAIASTSVFLMQRSSGGTSRKTGAVDLHGILVLDSTSTLNFGIAQFNTNDASFPAILRAGAMASFTRIS